MNKNILCLTGIAFIAAACARDMPEPVVDCDNFDLSSCDTVKIPADCTTGEPGNNGEQSVTVTVNSNPIVVAPPNRCIQTSIGYEVTFKISPANVQEGSVWICPKKPEDTWLKGNNAPDNRKIIITVPTKDYPDEGEDHDYTVLRTDGKCLDPRVDVF